jgi:uncharacterized protein (DUF983 family)
VTSGSETPASAGVTPLRSAFGGLCPRCGARSLFSGIATFAPGCRACGLDFSAFNVGDGPAAFLIFIVGGVVVALAIAVELSFSPPWWLHVLLWLPLTAILTVGLLRIAKAMLLALEWSGRHALGMAEDCRGPSSPDHRHRAREGRIAEGE